MLDAETNPKGMGTFWLMYNWSRMTGKLIGIPTINTNTLTNEHCISMRNASDKHICSHCYSFNALLGFRANCTDRFQANSNFLSERIHESYYLPKATSVIARFNGHGELINEIHLINYLNICKAQPNTIFALWTKRSDLVNSVLLNHPKPTNLILVYSNSLINSIQTEIPKHFDKVFNVVTENIDQINCVGKCVECALCYTHNDSSVIVEKIKK